MDTFVLSSRHANYPEDVYDIDIVFVGTFREACEYAQEGFTGYERTRTAMYNPGMWAAYVGVDTGFEVRIEKKDVVMGYHK